MLNDERDVLLVHSGFGSWDRWLMADPVVSVVTGANSGIGRATATHLAKHGHTVYGTVRASSWMGTFHAMVEELGVNIRLVEMDVADDRSVADGFAEILGEAGRVDVL